jgi:hypothetical protein
MLHGIWYVTSEHGARFVVLSFAEHAKLGQPQLVWCPAKMGYPVWR